MVSISFIPKVVWQVQVQVRWSSTQKVFTKTGVHPRCHQLRLSVLHNWDCWLDADEIVLKRSYRNDVVAGREMWRDNFFYQNYRRMVGNCNVRNYHYHFKCKEAQKRIWVWGGGGLNPSIDHQICDYIGIEGLKAVYWNIPRISSNWIP